MDFRTYFFGLSNEDREVFADKCDTSAGHLRNVAYGYKLPSTELAVAIEKQSKKAVTRQEMFPDTFKQKWPELRAA
jgi:hypothetical protein